MRITPEFLRRLCVKLPRDLGGSIEVSLESPAEAEDVERAIAGLPLVAVIGSDSARIYYSTAKEMP